MVPASHEAPVTQLLARARAGDAQALGAAYSAVYEELKHAARSQLRRMRDAFQTTALVHEADLKLAGGAQLAAVERNHLLALSARAMRQVAIAYARSRLAARRGGAALSVDPDPLADHPLPVDAQAEQLLAIDAALTKLAVLDERLVKVVEMRFFAGLEVSEIAELLGVSEPTIKRDTRVAKAFLQRELARPLD